MEGLYWSLGFVSFAFIGMALWASKESKRTGRIKKHDIIYNVKTNEIGRVIAIDHHNRVVTTTLGDAHLNDVKLLKKGMMVKQIDTQMIYKVTGITKYLIETANSFQLISKVKVWKQ